MLNFAELTTIPPDDSINTGKTSPKNSFMLSLLGVPGAKTRDCSGVTNAILKANMAYGVKIAPNMKVSGLRPVVDALKAVFDKVKLSDPRLASECRTAGMLCCRLQRGSDTLFSNHSWGTAIDIYFGDGVVPQGQPKTHVGIIKLYPYFSNAGFYWGAEFGNPDGMHLETSTELLKKWRKEGRI